jgi:hypothetical protein
VASVSDTDRHGDSKRFLNSQQHNCRQHKTHIQDRQQGGKKRSRVKNEKEKIHKAGRIKKKTNTGKEENRRQGWKNKRGRG